MRHFSLVTWILSPTVPLSCLSLRSILHQLLFHSTLQSLHHILSCVHLSPVTYSVSARFFFTFFRPYRSRVNHRCEPLACSFSEQGAQVQFSIASEAAAIIELTNRAIVLKDDDAAFISEGCLTIHRMKRSPEIVQMNIVHCLQRILIVPLQLLSHHMAVLTGAMLTASHLRRRRHNEQPGLSMK